MTEPNYALTYVEIDVDYCSLTYGAGLCTAAIGVTGDIKCFNTLATCQDRSNFTNAPVTLRFAVASDYRPQDIEVVAASIVGVEYSPATISLGEDLGQRASLRVSFTDHRSSDTGPGGDKYLADRDYVPFEQGTFWGKFRKRQNFLRGRPMRWIQGLVGQAIEDMETRHFVIESFDGPTLDGRFTITAKDTLKLADGDRAKAPLLSKGYLNADITNSATTATLAPVGIGNSDYPASGHLNIGGKEIVSFTRSGDTLTITRAQDNTTAVAHSAGDRCQICLSYTAEDPADVIADLFENYAAIDAAFIPIAAWQAETGAYYRRVVTARIAEPTSVKTLVSELVQQCGLAIWWDDVGQQIRLRVLRAISTDAERFTEDNTVRGSLAVREQPNKRISRVWVFFGLKNPLLPLDEPFSYRSSAERVDLDAEEDYGQPAIKTIFSRWIPFGGLSVAERLTAIQLGRFRTAPRQFTFNLFRRGQESPELGEGCRLEGQSMQDATGALEDVPIQITSIRPGDAESQVEAEEQLFVEIGDPDDPNLHSIIIDANINNQNLKTIHDALYADTPNGLTVDVAVNAGVIVGSGSTATPALDVGTWPTQAVTGNRTSGSPIITGLTVDTADWAAVGQRVFGTGIPAGAKILTVDSTSQITLTANASSGSSTATALTVHTVIVNLKLRGRVRGKGGKGGDGPSVKNTPGQAGSVGGVALYSRYGINVDLSTGDAEIWGGGGGGGGEGGSSGIGPGLGDGGGGGGGTTPGAGGIVYGTEGTGPFEYQPGSPGTSDAGGAARSGGDGGAPGFAGAAGANGTSSGGAGGAAGASIDGVSYVAKTGTGDIRGSEIN